MINERLNMSMSDLAIDIQEDIEAGLLSFESIATKYGVPLRWVNAVYEMMCEQESEIDGV